MIVIKLTEKSLNSKEKLEDVCRYIKEKSMQEEVIVTVPNFIQKKEPSAQGCKREADAYITAAQIQSASSLAMRLNKHGVKAQSFSAQQVPIFSKGGYGCSLITCVGKNSLQDCIAAGCIPVVADGQGVNEQSRLVTLSKSSSTAMTLGAIFDCNVVVYSKQKEIYAGSHTNHKKVDQDESE